MSILEEKRRIAQEQIESVIALGAPIVKMDIFDSLEHYVPSERTKNKIECTIDLYKELALKLASCTEKEKKAFLTTLKDADTIDNHSIEKEDSFMIALYRNIDADSAVDELIKLFRQNKQLTREEFVRIHDILLSGTSSDNKLGLRDDDLKFVGSFSNNPNAKFTFEGRAISYFPLRHEEIDLAIQKLLNFFSNAKRLDAKYDDLLIPIAFHGLIACLQIFKDGNTRYGRIFQSLIMFNILNKKLDSNLKTELPLVYATRQYEAYRANYRGLIEGIVLKNDNEAWDDWFSFNLMRIQDSIFYNMNCLEKIQNQDIKTQQKK